MQSIFIWKTDNENGLSDILYHSGSDWFMEEHNDKSYSYQYNNQVDFELDNDTILVYQVTAMPSNWVGSDLLESSNVKYKVHKNDSYGKLDQLGCWMRFISKDSTFCLENLKEEFKKIRTYTQ